MNDKMCGFRKVFKGTTWGLTATQKKIWHDSTEMDQITD